LILGFQKLPGGGFVVGLQAGTLAGLGVHAIELAPAEATTNETELSLHIVQLVNTRILKPCPNRYRVTGQLTPIASNSHGVGELVSVLVSVVDPLAPKPLLQK
jgi:hypothetical protein